VLSGKTGKASEKTNVSKKDLQTASTQAKTCSIPLAIRKMQIQTKISHVRLARMG
jgi:hypothetical protein